MSFWSWLSSSENFVSPCSPDVLLASSRSALASTSATEESAMAAKSTQNDVASKIAQIEGAQALAAGVGAVEEAPVDAAVGLSSPFVGLLDRKRAVRQRRPRHLHAAEPAGLEHRRQLHLRRVDLLHAADVLVAGEAVDVAVEKGSAEFDAPA